MRRAARTFVFDDTGHAQRCNANLLTVAWGQTKGLGVVPGPESGVDPRVTAKGVRLYNLLTVTVFIHEALSEWF